MAGLIIVRCSTRTIRPVLVDNVYTISSSRFFEHLDGLFLMAQTLPDNYFALFGEQFKHHREVIRQRVERLKLTNIVLYRIQLTKKRSKKSLVARLKPRDSLGKFTK